MDLRDKLKLIDNLNHQKIPAERQKTDPDIEKYLDGEYESTPYGPCFTTSQIYEKNHNHGDVKINIQEQYLRKYLTVIGKDNKLKKMDLKKTLFFDTETTGLSSGTGTHIFLAGFGYFTDTAFIVKQYFLRDFDEELAFLSAINQLLREFTGIVSYNGKSFDWPQLQTRFIYSRMTCELPSPLHLDLVHSTRRIWKKRLADCSLQNIEVHELNYHRNGDIPGALIPSVYFQYLRDKNPQPLAPILRHNEKDIVSLTALLSRLLKIYHAPFEHLSHHFDVISLGQAYENMKDWQKSVLIYENLLETIEDYTLRNQIMFQLSFCYKRLGKWESAVNLWKDIISNGYSGIEPYIELAKYYEHICRDYSTAEEFVNKAMERINIAEQLRGYSEYKCEKDDLHYRLNRLQKKGKNGR